jgi:MSHA pilin protein MshC
MRGKRHKLPKDVSGFTLVELIIVIIITGILAVAVIPRFVDNKAFDGRGFSDQTLAALRYAQKTAIAQRRNVCVDFTTNTVTLRIANAAGAIALAPCNTPLTSPTGVTPFVITARPGINFSGALPVNLSFSALGQPSTNAAVVLNISDGSTTWTVNLERDTGYVRS